MPILKQNESTFQPVPAGLHPARCYGMVSLGTQLPTNPTYNKQFKVALLFEFPGEPLKVGDALRCMTTTHFLNAYLGSTTKPSKTNLFLTAWRGRQFTETELTGFDLSKVVGAPCMVNIVHETKNGKLRDSIASISPLAKGMTVPTQVHPTVVYEVEQGKDATFQALPEWMQKMIGACEEWVHPAIGANEAEGPDDGEPSDVPF